MRLEFYILFNILLLVANLLIFWRIAKAARHLPALRKDMRTQIELSQDMYAITTKDYIELSKEIYELKSKLVYANLLDVGSMPKLPTLTSNKKKES